MKKVIKALILLLVISPTIFASSINFSSGYTTLSMKEGNQQVSLNNSAYVKIDNLELTADQIDISGENYNDIECNNNVKFIDSENEITLRCSSLKYNQSTKVLLINGWVEINDLKNNIFATASYLKYDLENSLLDLMIEVKLLHDSDNSIMKCNSDSLRFDMRNNNLSLLGNSKVIWQNNTYSAQAISINLENNDISMDGNIEANITTE
jgi:lipopolysaccharide export system protein LptA